MIRLALALAAIVIAAGCVSPPKAYLPVDNQLRQWEAPEVAEAEEAAPAPAPATPAPAAKKPAK